MFVKQKVVRSWATQRAISQDNPTKWWCAINSSMCRDSLHDMLHTLGRCSHHSHLAVNTLRHATIEDRMGAKLTVNGDTCNVSKSSPFLCEKCIARVRTGSVCTLCDVTRAWHCPLFFGAGSSRKSSKQHEDGIFIN